MRSATKMEQQLPRGCALYVTASCPLCCSFIYLLRRSFSSQHLYLQTSKGVHSKSVDAGKLIKKAVCRLTGKDVCISLLLACCLHQLTCRLVLRILCTGTATRPGVHSVSSMLMTAQASQQQRSPRHVPLPSVFDSAPGSFWVLLFSGILALLKKNTYPPNKKVAPTTPYKGKRLPALRD